MTRQGALLLVDDNEANRDVLSRRLRLKGYQVTVASDGLWDWNLSTNQVYRSGRWKSMLGYGEEEIGVDPNEWFSRVHPDDLAGVKE